jgi:hypothetical protein
VESVSLSPNTANVELGAVQPFQASVKSQGRPDPSVRWSLAGTSCPNTCGIQVGSSPVSTELGQILDADIYFNPSNSSVTFATPSALGANPTSYDLQSILTHEFGHLLGFSHSAVWSAMMYPFAPAPGTYANERPTAQTPDASLADDDRTGLRTLYPDPTDTQYIGSIQGLVLPANPLSLPRIRPMSRGFSERTWLP